MDECLLLQVQVLVVLGFILQVSTTGHHNGPECQGDGLITVYFFFKLFFAIFLLHFCSMYLFLTHSQSFILFTCHTTQTLKIKESKK